MYGIFFISSYTTGVELIGIKNSILLSHPQAIEMYEDKIIIDENQIVSDVKFLPIGGMISTLRNEVYRYNKSLNTKLFIKRNILFSWYIYIPKALQLIELKTLMKEEE